MLTSAPRYRGAASGYILHLLSWRVRTTRFDRFPTYDCSWLPGLRSPSRRNRHNVLLSEGHVSSRACKECARSERLWAKGRMDTLVLEQKLSQGHHSRRCGWELSTVGSILQPSPA